MKDEFPLASSEAPGADVVDALRQGLEHEGPDADARLGSILADEEAHDVAPALQYLEEEEKVRVFRLLDVERAAVVLDETDEVSRGQIIEALTSKDLARLLGAMPPDEAADLLDVLPDEDKEAALGQIPAKRAARLRELDRFDPETAGGLMTTDYVALAPGSTADEAVEQIRGSERAETVERLFVVDDDGHLKGVVSLRSLVTAPRAAAVGDLAERDFHSVRLGEDQESIANLVRRYDEPVIPVVDDSGRLRGIVTIDDVIDVMSDEAAEDMLRLAGTSNIHPTHMGVANRVAKRLPFLATTLAGGLAASFLLGRFVGAQWYTFTPVVLGMAGNVGIQSSTVMVRGLATGEVDAAHPWRAVLSEIAVGMLVALVCGLAAGTLAAVIGGAARTGVAVGLAMWIGITVAAVNGSVIPLGCNKVRIDPAIAAGPFITTLNDVTGVLIFSFIAHALVRSA